MTLLKEDQRISSPSFFPAFRLYFFKAEKPAFISLQEKGYKGMNTLLYQGKGAVMIPSSAASPFLFFWNLNHLLGVISLFTGGYTKCAVSHTHWALGTHGLPQHALGSSAAASEELTLQISTCRRWLFYFRDWFISEPVLIHSTEI